MWFPALQPGECCVHRLNLPFLVLCSLAPLKIKEVIKPLMGMHAQRYRFFTQLAVRTGLLKKIPLKRALQALQLLILHKGCSYELLNCPNSERV